MKISSTEENYLKAIFHLCEENKTDCTSTNVLAKELSIKPASVSAMLKKLTTKDYINYKPYSDVVLTDKGRKIAVRVIRKHRLWEVFLVESLGFSWDEVHEVAEQLEHIKSEKLIDKLDAFLRYPKTDPHGDPIPTPTGKLTKIKKQKLNEAKPNMKYEVVAVSDSSSEFLQFLIQQNIGLGTKIELISQNKTDNSLLVQLTTGKRITLAENAASNIQVI